MNRFINIRTVLAVLVVLLTVTGPQAQTTTGRLVGTVVDETGAVLPGVTVTISSPALIGGARIKITDGAGEFAFIGIAPGEYTLKVDLSGFISQERNEILVALGGSRSIIIEMPQGTFGGEIEVVAETPVTSVGAGPERICGAAAAVVEKVSSALSVGPLPVPSVLPTWKW